MPDITMCDGERRKTGEVCPLRNKCFRYTARPDEGRQSYFTDAPFSIPKAYVVDVVEDQRCDYFMSNERKM